ncbi:MAG TPA: hypothetical protein VGM30_10150 [Puia sp.]|jgi:hypothetical protein
MKLTNIAIQAIARSSGIKLKLALALNCSEGSINRYIRENDDNLTKAAALEVIRKETGLTDEEILEKTSARSDDRL